MKRNTLNYVIDLIGLVVMWGLLVTGLLIKYVLPPGSGHFLAIGGMNRHDFGDIHFWLAIGVLVVVFLHVLLHWQWVCATTRKLVVSSTDPEYVGKKGWRAVWGLVLIVVLAGGATGLLLAANSAVAEIEGGAEEEAHERRGRNRVEGGDRVEGREGGERRGQGRRGGQGRGRQRSDEARPSERSGALDADRGRGPAREASETPGLGRGTAGQETGGREIRGSLTLGEAAAIKGMAVEDLKTALGLPRDVADDERLGRLGRRYGFTMSQVRDLGAAEAPSAERAGPR